MFKNTYQSDFLSILYSIGSKPLQIWKQNIENGYVKRIMDNDMQSSIIEISGRNVSNCYITCPENPNETLGIKMPYLVFLVKYMKKYFSFEVQVRDDKNVKRRFRASNYQSNTRVKPFICTIPMKLDEGWNQIHFNLTDFTRRAYGSNYLETLRVQIHANCRIRRIYFTDKLLSSNNFPDDYRIFSNNNNNNINNETNMNNNMMHNTNNMINNNEEMEGDMNNQNINENEGENNDNNDNNDNNYNENNYEENNENENENNDYNNNNEYGEEEM